MWTQHHSTLLSKPQVALDWRTHQLATLGTEHARWVLWWSAQDALDWRTHQLATLGTDHTLWVLWRSAQDNRMTLEHTSS